MGYTPAHTQLCIGLGVSAISDSLYGFAQDEKSVEGYESRIVQDAMPIFRGHILTAQDLILRRHILNIMCRLQTSWEKADQQHPSLFQALERMREIEADGLVRVGADSLQVKEEGRPFIRNICMALDARLMRQEPQKQIFSQVI